MPGLLPKGYVCKCGKEHLFSSYVYAQWEETLVHTCDSCGNVVDLFRGVVYEQKGDEDEED